MPWMLLCCKHALDLSCVQVTSLVQAVACSIIQYQLYVLIFSFTDRH